MRHIAEFFDGPFAGTKLEIAKPMSLILMCGEGDPVRYECDQLEELTGMRAVGSLPAVEAQCDYRFVLARDETGFDEDIITDHLGLDLLTVRKGVTSGMSEADYMAEARSQMLTDHGPVRDNPIMFCMAGMSEETAEAAAVKKLLRGDYPESDFVVGGPRHEALVKELGDCMWYLYNLMDRIGVNPGVVRRLNHEKCVDRHARGVVRGDGDNR